MNPHQAAEAMNVYTLSHELIDGTLERPFISYPTKKTALRVARCVAKLCADSFDVARIVVEKDEMTVKTFEVERVAK